MEKPEWIRFRTVKGLETNSFCKSYDIFPHKLTKGLRLPKCAHGVFLRSYQGAFCVLKKCRIVTKAVPYQGQYIFIYLIIIYEQHYFMVFEAPVIHEYFSGFQQTKIKNILNSF